MLWLACVYSYCCFQSKSANILLFLAWKQINPESSSPRSWFSTVGWRPAWSLFDQVPFPASCSDALSFGCLFRYSSDPLVSGNLVLEDLFSLEIKSEERGQKFHSDDVHYADLGSTSDWSCRVGIWPQPIRSTIQTWVLKSHQYGIATLIFQTS